VELGAENPNFQMRVLERKCFMVLTGLGLTSNREMGAWIIRNYLRKMRKISELRRWIVKWHQEGNEK